ncbi:phage tail protein [Cupriavidus sp. CuC1]|uniref:phage tail protein n=1 Tax=Cupriavidus sp. CuC1 TaxID=3373131 RepID=UPI0037CF5746
MPTLAHHELQHQAEWKHPSVSRVGSRDAHQYTGPGDESITLPGWIAPEEGFAGSALSLDVLRFMADAGDSYPLVEGSGRIYGAYVIPGMSETRAILNADGSAKRIEFSISLKRVDENRRRLQIALMAHPRPAVRVTLDGLDLTSKIMPRLVSLTLTDCRENESDQLDLTVSDHDGPLEIPPRGAEITLAIGWQGTPLAGFPPGFPAGVIDKGTFIVDEVEHSGAPDVLVVHARASNLLHEYRELKERSWHKTTVGSIVKTIAGEHGLTARVAAGVGSRPIDHADQTNESNANFLRRLGKQFDAVATVKAGVLLFLPAAEARAASGNDLPPLHIVRRDGDGHRYYTADRDSYTGVRAFWHDPKQAKRRSVVAGIGGNAKRLRTTFANEKDALYAARSEWHRIRRGIFSFEYTLAYGRADIAPQTPVSVSGLKPQMMPPSGSCTACGIP